MMRHSIVVLLILFLNGMFIPLHADGPGLEGGDFSFRLSGFVKTDYWLDSRSVIAAREDLFLLFPAKRKPDEFGKDLNGDPVFNFSAITSRTALHLEGPETFGARLTGLIEADFSGVTNADINGFRLRHAYMHLQWEKWGLLLGQWWHPMFAGEVVPTVVSLNTGAPFQPFIRNPQFTLTRLAGNSRFLFSAIAQRDNASDGPQGTTPDYMRYAARPNVHFQWTLQRGSWIGGLAADYKVIRPLREAEGWGRVSETLGTHAFMAYGAYRHHSLEVKAKAIYGQNLSEHLLLGGYAHGKGSGVDGPPVFEALDHGFVWGNVVYGDRIRAGLFGGYAKNFGASNPIEGPIYGRGGDIAHMYRVAPSLTFRSARVDFCAELEYTVAAYGDADHMGKVTNTTEVGNLRLLFTALYYFDTGRR